MVLKLQQKTLNLVILEKRFAFHVIVRISICYLSYVDSVDSALAKNLQNMHYNIKIEVISTVIYTCMYVQLLWDCDIPNLFCSSVTYKGMGGSST